MSGYIGTQPVPQATQHRQAFTATAGQTSFATAGFQAGYLDIHLNGVKLQDGVDYAATNGSDIVLTVGAAAGDVLEFVAYTAFEVLDQTFTGTTTVDALVATGTLSVSSTQPVINLVETDTSNQHRIIGSDGSLYIQAQDSDGTTDGDMHLTGYFNTDLNLLNIKAVTTAMNGNVGIGTTSPSSMLTTDGGDIEATGANRNQSLIIGRTDAGNNYDWRIAGGSTGDVQALRFVDNKDGADAERMRIDASGNLLVGTTTAPAFGKVNFGASIYVSGPVGDENSGIYMGLSGVYPSANGALTDNLKDLGNISYRWDDVFATNGTIQTSDRNEKEAIASLTPTEMLVAARLSSSFKNFKWKDAVAEKGAAARMHSGIIAQDVQAAFTAEGLDAGDYSMFISGTWWEHEGTTYDTLEEAPVGATERTRLGVRYPELLAFVAAYSDQRFISIETRLAELEATS